VATGLLGGRAHSTFRRWQCWLESEAAIWDAVLLMPAGITCSAHGEAKGAGSRVDSHFAQGYNAMGQGSKIN